MNSSLFVLHSSLNLLRLVGQIVSEVRRLIVAYILPSHSHAIHMVVHQGRHSIIGRRIGGEDIEMRGIALIPVDDLLSPITEQVGLKVGSCLRPVATYRMSHLEELLSIAQWQSHRFLSTSGDKEGNEGDDHWQEVHPASHHPNKCGSSSPAYERLT